MAHRRVEIAQAVKNVARAAGARVTITTTGRNHQRAEIEFAGQSRRVSISNTPSDRNGFKAAARDARQALREMGAML